MYTLINHELKLESVIPFIEVSWFFFEWKINEHAQALVKGIVDITQLAYANSQQTDKLLSDDKIIAFNNTDFKIIYSHESDGEEILFHGVINNLKQSIAGGILFVEITVESASKELDRDQESCSYQNISMSYADIARETTENAGGKIICTAGKEEQIRMPYIQYQETAWEFLKRIASHLNQCVIADVISGKPALWFGMRLGKEINEINVVNMNVSIFRKYENSTVNYPVINYSVHSTKNFSLGDYISINGVPYLLSNKKAEFKKGELVFYYIFVQKNNIGLTKIYNTRFTGLSLLATVEKVERESIYVSFDIDRKAGAYPYLWKTESGNSLYCMPEIGTTVTLYFPGPNENEAFGVRCLNRNWKRQDKEKEYSYKTFDTPERGQVNLFPTSMEINKSDTDEGNCSMAILDGYGISMDSAKRIDLVAVGNIQVNSPVIRITGLTEIKMES